MRKRRIVHGPSLTLFSDVLQEIAGELCRSGRI
jgi:hypothetical protein